MRKELNDIELIEKHLLGTLNEEEKIAFEKRMGEDPLFKDEVKLQAELQEGIETASVRSVIQKAFRKYKLFKNGLRWGLGSAGLVIATAAVMWATDLHHYEGSSFGFEVEAPKYNEQGDTLWADADKYLPSQSFVLNTDQDTVIETEGGIVMVVPANCFLDENGKPVRGTIELDVKEALDPASIIKGGLSTMSGERLLQTGGMFYINGKKEGQQLKIDPKNGIYTEVPTQNFKSGMQLFDGKRMPDGSIDWINPKKLEKFLVPVDIMSLDFYPPNYLKGLEQLGQDYTNNKEFRDSLYYAMAKYFSQPTSTEIEHEVANSNFVVAPDSTEDSELNTLLNSLVEEDGGYEEDRAWFIQGLNPAKVKTIWNKKFDGTLLATREFEERMIAIHNSCNVSWSNETNPAPDANNILGLYVNNLDKPMYYIDSLAYELTKANNHEFEEFNKRRDGRMEKGNRYAKKLAKYYQEKQDMYTKAIAKTQQKFWNDQAKKDNEATVKKGQQIKRDMERETKLYTQEFNLNLDEAYRQLGKKRPQPLPPGTYSAVVTRTGWKNVDQYVAESTTNRTTLDYTDPETGKKAVIKYEELTASIANDSIYDRVMVYLLPDKLDSYQRVRKTENIYKENLNELIKYDLLCVGIKGNDFNISLTEDVEPTSYMDQKLEYVKESRINYLLHRGNTGGMTQKVMQDLRYHQFEVKDDYRKKKNQNLRELEAMIVPNIFPCTDLNAESRWAISTRPDTSSTSIEAFDWIE